MRYTFVMGEVTFTILLGFLTYFWIIFIFRVRVFQFFGYQEASIPAGFDVDDLLLSRFWSSSRLNRLHGTWRVRCAAVFPAYVDIVVLCTPAC